MKQKLKMRFEHGAQALDWMYRVWQLQPFAGEAVRVRLAQPHEDTTLQLAAGMGRMEFLLLLNALPADELTLAAGGTVASCFVQELTGYLRTEGDALYQMAARPVVGQVLPMWAAKPQICRFGSAKAMPPHEVVGWLMQQPVFAAARVQARYRDQKMMGLYAGPQRDAELMLLTAVDESRQVMAGYCRGINGFVLYGPPGAVCPFLDR